MRLGSLAFFALFLPYVLLLHTRVFSRANARALALLALGLVFLGSRGPGTMAYIVGLTVFVCWAAQYVHRHRPRFWLATAAIVLAWAISRHFGDLGVSPSYITFFLLAYLTEVYWGRQTPVQNPGSFAAAAISPSHISAGPVPEPLHYLRDLRSPLSFDNVLVREALLRIMSGITKKAVGDAIYNWALVAKQFDPGGGGVPAWTLELARGARVYADFSGYADIAIGVGLLLGHRLPEDFRLPFLATSVSTYWRSWNASISRFFLHYVFTPMSLTLRHLPPWLAISAAAYTALLLSGLWHGFTWNQAVWGLLVGSIIVVEGGLRLQARLSAVPGGVFASWLLTFYLMCLARVFSLEDSLAEAWKIIGDLHSDFSWRPRLLRGLVVAALAITLPHLYDWWRSRRPQLHHSLWEWCAVMAALMFVFWFFSDAGMPFVYEGY